MLNPPPPVHASVAPVERDFRQHLALETPEHVVLDYEIAGVGSRVLAALIDWSIVGGIVIVLGFAMALAGRVSHRNGFTIIGWIVMTYGTVWGYFSLFEGLRHGQTPGKRFMGLRTIRDSGHGISFADAAARSLLQPIDLGTAIGVVLIAVHPKAKRLGDFVAGTVVVRDAPIAMSAPNAVIETGEDAGPPQLSDTEFQLLRGFTGRAESLAPPIRDRFAAQLAARFASHRPAQPVTDLAFVTQLHADEAARRRGRYGARSGVAAARSSSVAERFTVRKSGRWTEFSTIVDRVTLHGLDALSARELLDFALRYREVASDLARARTYRADRLVLARLERLVAAGHSALYRSGRQTWQRIWQFVSRECPGAIVGAWRYVAVAYLVFLVPAGAGYALLRDKPQLAPILMPDTMLERAEAGAARVAAGKGYVQADASARPVIAAEIITNNIRVAFTCFAGGVVLGVGSLLVLGMNGLSLGATSGYFANMGMLGYLWTFVAGHGVLEITALCLASAAGFMLGLAVIAPGSRRRSDALTLAGHRAMRLIGAVVILLVIAGTIEGMVSASGSPLAARLAISGGSALFLLLYLANGAKYR